jgi:transposase
VSDDTPRERIVLDPGEARPDCGGDLRLLGVDVSKILELITARLKVIHCPAVDCVQSTRGRSRG